MVGMSHLPFFILLLVIVITYIEITPVALSKNETPVHVYVDKLPKWASYAGHVLYDSTKSWENANSGLKFYQVSTPTKADFTVKWVKEFGGERVDYTHDGRQFIEVGLGDSNCKGKWQPYATNYINHIMEHEIGHVFYYKHSPNPDDMMYPPALWYQYGVVDEQYNLTSSHAQFISLCTNKNVTSYDYSISTSESKYGFDIYFVPSIDEFYKWQKGKTFSHYSGKGCLGKNHLMFSGSCKGISGEGGLLVIMPKKLTKPLAQINVKLIEK